MVDEFLIYPSSVGIKGFYHLKEAEKLSLDRLLNELGIRFK